MRLRFLGIDTGKDGCPTLYATDRDTYVVQGWRVNDSAILGRLRVASSEACVEVPERLMSFLEHDPSCQTDVGSEEPFLVTDRRTYVIKGWRLTDQEALSQMEIPSHEAAVELPRYLMGNITGVIECSG